MWWRRDVGRKIIDVDDDAGVRDEVMFEAEIIDVKEETDVTEVGAADREFMEGEREVGLAAMER